MESISQHDKPRYRSLNRYLRDTFGCRVQKITVDAGFTCPNRDGSAGEGGCIYCNNQGFSPALREKQRSLEEQIRLGIANLGKRYRAQRFLVYFQPYSNTYAPLKKLKTVYEEALAFNEVVGLCIGTRPDCVSDNVLDLLQSYAEKYEIWLEYGLQSIHNTTLETINRGHDLETFIDAVLRTRRRGIKICAHVIFGLPGETHRMMMETVQKAADLALDGIKFHVLHVLKETKLEKAYRAGRVQLMGEEDYVRLVVNALERLPSNVVVHRLASDASPELLIAPKWCLKKSITIERIQRELQARDAWQGKKT